MKKKLEHIWYYYKWYILAAALVIGAQQLRLQSARADLLELRAEYAAATAAAQKQARAHARLLGWDYYDMRSNWLAFAHEADAVVDDGDPAGALDIDGAAQILDPGFQVGNGLLEIEVVRVHAILRAGDGDESGLV